MYQSFRIITTLKGNMGLSTPGSFCPDDIHSLHQATSSPYDGDGIHNKVTAKTASVRRAADLGLNVEDSAEFSTCTHENRRSTFGGDVNIEIAGGKETFRAQCKQRYCSRSLSSL